MRLARPDLGELLKQDEGHYCEGVETRVCVKVVAVADFPTRFGKFDIIAFYNNHDEKEHVAVVRGDFSKKDNIPVRLHSECLTGDALGSLRCDCRDQLIAALSMIGRMRAGILIYLRQEGRGIGLLNKLRAYQLQDHGCDTFEANRALGFADDQRDFSIAAHILRTLKVRSVRLITNNPRKIEALERHGVRVTGRIPVAIPPNAHNLRYLSSKMEKTGHFLQEVLGTKGEKRQKGGRPAGKVMKGGKGGKRT
jgi:GTP cyclohydrolase II